MRLLFHSLERVGRGSLKSWTSKVKAVEIFWMQMGKGVKGLEN